MIDDSYYIELKYKKNYFLLKYLKNNLLRIIDVS